MGFSCILQRTQSVSKSLWAALRGILCSPPEMASCVPLFSDVALACHTQLKLSSDSVWSMTYVPPSGWHLGACEALIARMWLALLPASPHRSSPSHVQLPAIPSLPPPPLPLLSPSAPCLPTSLDSRQNSKTRATVFHGIEHIFSPPPHSLSHMLFPSHSSIKLIHLFHPFNSRHT